MKVRDIALTPIHTAYSKVQTLAAADSDQNDIPTVMSSVTLTNDTDVTLSIKNTRKGTPSGDGRTLLTGESFNFLEVDLTEMYIKSASAPTGKVILTGYIS